MSENMSDDEIQECWRHIHAGDCACSRLAMVLTEVERLRAEPLRELAKAIAALKQIDQWMPPATVADPYQDMVLACKEIARQALKEIQS